MTQPTAPQPHQILTPPPAAPQLLRCRFCGCVPAVQTTFRGHQGIIVMMRFLSVKGPFCRDCGMAAFRDMTSKTLVQGWYSYGSLIAAPITVLINLFRRDKVASLPAPQPLPDGNSRTPMDPGKRLLARPMTIIGLCIPFALVALLVLLAGLNSDA
ncbi:hypothetical protein [Dactylosporangium sp. NPDC048998]|uniref:hypothetical protein n=1 Tax=Dactylosporangium sp. NPDC048998 TaxID=3363976 RepID=UPI003713C2F7